KYIVYQRHSLDNILLWIVVFITSRDKHYYDEDNIEVGKSINCQVVVNHTIELTEEEKAEARKKAIERYQAEEYRKLTTKKPKAEKQVEQQIAQPSLFEF
uniref:PcfK-like family protein n=1 Tax=Prevotella conceptionensis TaxID=340486 RepID=UPI001E576717